MHEEFFLPGEVIIEEGSIGDQLYFLCDGRLVCFILARIRFIVEKRKKN